MKQPMLSKLIFLVLVVVLLFFLLPIFFGEDEESLGEALEPAVTQLSGKTFSVFTGDEIVEMDVNDYLWGVLAAEMPASFEEEALKAQAVAARTYAMDKSARTNSNHPDADVCCDHTCCQAYISKEDAMANWGDSASYYADKITTAINETGNEVLLYEGNLITAVFHSSSAGATEDAVAVWGNAVPYLVSVESPEGETVPNYNSEVTFSAEEFASKIKAYYPEANLEGSATTWIGASQLAASGSVSEILVGGVSIRGTSMRSILGLRSTTFTVTTYEDQLIFSVTGYGHGVGMSQYGANTMAAEGSNYEEILTWYYTGVTVETCPEEFWQ